MSQYDVFISHSHVDYRFCRRIYRALTDADARVWYDESDLQIGELTPEITQALRDSDALVAVLTPDALKSSWVALETQFFHQLPLASGVVSHRIVPVVARDIVGLDVWPWLEKDRYVRVTGPEGIALRPKRAIGEVLRRLGYIPAQAEIQLASSRLPPGTRYPLTEQAIYLYQENIDTGVQRYLQLPPPMLEAGAVEIRRDSSYHYQWRFVRHPEPAWSRALGRGIPEMRVQVNGVPVEPSDDVFRRFKHNDRLQITMLLHANPDRQREVEATFGWVPASRDPADFARVTTVTFKQASFA